MDGAAVWGTEPDSEIAESLSMRHDLTDGHGEGVASPDYLWWPPHKVGGRYLAPWLAGATSHAEPGAPPTRWRRSCVTQRSGTASRWRSIPSSRWTTCNARAEIERLVSMVEVRELPGWNDNRPPL
jgi:hypothetical protein